MGESGKQQKYQNKRQNHVKTKMKKNNENKNNTKKCIMTNKGQKIPLIHDCNAKIISPKGTSDEK